MSEKCWLFADCKWHGSLVKELGTPITEKKFSQGDRLEVRKLIGSLFDLLEHPPSLESLLASVNEERFILISWNRPLYWWVNIYYIQGEKKRYIYDYREFVGYLHSLAIIPKPDPSLGDIILYEILSPKKLKKNSRWLLSTFSINFPKHYRREFENYPVYILER